MNSHSRSRWRGSSDDDGSSSGSTGGSASSPTAMLTRWRLPPDSVPSSSPARLAEAGLLEHPRHDGVGVGDALQAREQPQVLGHAELGVDRRLLGHPADLARRCGSPCRWSARCSPARIDSSVVLPAPLGPMTATTSPGVRLEADVAQRLARAVALRHGRGRDGRAAGCGRAHLPDGTCGRARSAPQVGQYASPAAQRPPHSGQRMRDERASTISSGVIVPHGSRTRCWRR